MGIGRGGEGWEMRDRFRGAKKGEAWPVCFLFFLLFLGSGGVEDVGHGWSRARHSSNLVNLTHLTLKKFLKKI
jgi:hypothetical protein